MNIPRQTPTKYNMRYTSYEVRNKSYATYYFGLQPMDTPTLTDEQKYFH